jgi:hypothetical protein
MAIPHSLSVRPKRFGQIVAFVRVHLRDHRLARLTTLRLILAKPAKHLVAKIGAGLGILVLDSDAVSRNVEDAWFRPSYQGRGIHMWSQNHADAFKLRPSAIVPPSPVDRSIGK